MLPRRILVALVFAAGTALLLWRAIDLQLNHKDFLQRQGEVRHLRVVAMPAHRGNIFDRHGEPLAVSTPVDSVWFNPQELRPDEPGLAELVRLLGLDGERLGALLKKRNGKEFVYLKRHIGPDLAARVEGLHLPGVYLQREYRRYYPAGAVTAHVVGFTDVDDQGQEGLELHFNDLLTGVPGAKRVLRDRLGRAVRDVEMIRTPKAGGDLHISIDRRIQYRAYRALRTAVTRHRARSATAVVLDVRNGEVLAMVNQPSHNPNNRADRVSERFRNRAVTDVLEPGSAIKPFTVISALETGQFAPATVIDTSPGQLRVSNHTIKDNRNLGPIDLATVIQKSSNVGASKIALALAPEQLWRTLSRVGFGEATGIGFPGEAQGTLAHFFDWHRVQQATLSFGYGLAVTPLQLAHAYAVIANDGMMQPPGFLRVADSAGGTRVISAQTAGALRRMLESAVAPGGTGTRGAVAGYRVAGKTGTSRKSIVGGYAEDRYMAVFAGFAPASDPRLVCVVVVDEPDAGEYYGGQVAAPVFAEIMAGALRLLGVPPDDHRVVTRRISLTELGALRKVSAP